MMLMMFDDVDIDLVPHVRSSEISQNVLHPHRGMSKKKKRHEAGVSRRATTSLALYRLPVSLFCRPPLPLGRWPWSATIARLPDTAFGTFGLPGARARLASPSPCQRCRGPSENENSFVRRKCWEHMIGRMITCIIRRKGWKTEESVDTRCDRGKYGIPFFGKSHFSLERRGAP